MRAVVLSCVFPPEPVTSASTSHAIAGELSRQGHEVTVIAPYPSRPGGRVFPGFRRRLFQQTREGSGIRLVRCFSTTSRTAALASRFLENLSFGLSGGLMLALHPRPDVVYSNTWPVFASLIAALTARLRRVPIVVSVQDVYPESLFSLHKLSRGSALARLLRSVDALVARWASGVIVISPSARATYLADRRVPAHRVHLIPNWRDPAAPPPPGDAVRRRTEWGLASGAFLFLFAGNVAAACGLEQVIEAAGRLPAAPPFGLVIAGAGGALQTCRELARRAASRKIIFPGAFQARETLSILGAADVLILPTQGDQSLVSMPSKLIPYMLAARPVLAVARAGSDLARVVNESGCGWVVEPGDPAQLASRMAAAMALGPPELDRMGALGRQYALARFSTQACLPSVIHVLENAAL